MALAFLLCGAVLSVPLVALRTDHGPGTEDVVSMGRGTAAATDLAERIAVARASRSGRRTPAGAGAGGRTIELGEATVAGAPMPSIVETGWAATTSTTTPPVVKPAAARPAPKPAPKPAAKSKPATTSTTRRRTQAAAPPPSPTTTTTRPQRDVPPPDANLTGNSQEGKATWYRADYHSDDPNICAHRTLPKGTVVQITNLANGKQTTCRVGDRGPYVEDRIIDLSPITFSRLASTSEGVINVRIEW